MYHANVNVNLMEESITQIKSGTTMNVDVSLKIYVKSIVFGILLHVVETKKQKLFQQNLKIKRATCKKQNFYILLAFLLISITLLIAVSIYCYLIKYRAKIKIFITIFRHK